MKNFRNKDLNIINISSTLGHVGSNNRTAYCMTKFGVEGFTKSLAVDLAKHKINLFIEKPLSNSLRKTKELSSVIKQSKIVVMMGHSYMFEKGFKKLKSLLTKKIIGDIYFVNYMQGQYLPDWHPWANYRKEYTARKDLGGGALLTLTSHTFYVLEWLFGRIHTINGAILQNTKSLDVDVDDSVCLLLQTNSGLIIQTLNNSLTEVVKSRQQRGEKRAKNATVGCESSPQFAVTPSIDTRRHLTPSGTSAATVGV